MSDDEKVIAEFGPPGKKLRLSLSQYGGQPLLNIRFYYEKDGEMKPTKKGIAISRNRFLDVTNTLESHHEAIATFMEDPLSTRLPEDIFEVKKDALDNIKVVEKANLFIAPVSGRKVSEVKYSGSSADITLNSNHKFVEKYADSEKEKELMKKIFIAFDLSRQLVAADEANDVQHALERLDAELSRQLKNITEV